jgi:hypothetical protein
MEVENKKLYLKEVKLMEANSNLKSQMQSMKQKLVESKIIMKEQTIPKHGAEHGSKDGSVYLKPKKESHSHRTQRILRAKVTEMNEKIGESERCLEKYAKAFSENQDLIVRADGLEQENSSLKTELETLKAKLDENKAMEEGDVLSIPNCLAPMC